MVQDYCQIPSRKGVVPGHLLQFDDDGTRTSGWEDLVNDQVFDRRSIEHSLSILACREYEENGSSQR
jgi:hypothetical protein